MKRKICISLLVLALCVGSILPASACTRKPSSVCKRHMFCMLGINRFCCSFEESPAVPEAPSVPNLPNEQPSEPGAPESPILPEQPSEPDAPNEDSADVHAYEREVVRLVNIEREKNGLSALTLREDLCIYARVKSQDMRDSGYFSHTSPNYGSPFEMMQSFGITYRTAGENIAMGYSTPQAVVQAWMNSEGHRANILSASYTHLGVGYVADGGYWTQWFVG